MTPDPVDAEDAMPWAEIEGLGDRTFMPEGREQPAMPTDRDTFD
jgi:antitoxin VapB